MRLLTGRNAAGAAVLAAVLFASAAAGCSGDDAPETTSSPAGVTAADVAGTSPTGTGSSTTSGSAGAGTASVGSSTGSSATGGPGPSTSSPAGSSAVPTAPPQPATAVGGAAVVCPGVASLPSTATRQTRVAADVDADGAPDTVLSYAADASPGAGDWHIRVTFGTGGGADLRLDEDPAPGTVRVLGTSYLGPVQAPDGLRPTIFAWTGSGASARTVGLYRVDGCELRPLLLEGGRPAGFIVGASVGHQEGLRCETVAGDSVVVEVVSEPSGDGHRVVRRTYRRDGNVLVADGPGLQSTESAAPPESGRILGCGDVPAS